MQSNHKCKSFDFRSYNLKLSYFDNLSERLIIACSDRDEIRST